MSQTASIWVFYPPLGKKSGGMAVLLQVVRQLQSLGRLGGVLVWEEKNAPDLADLPVQSYTAVSLQKNDVLLVPEGWPNALSLGLRVGCRVVLYCQNWAYLFHGLPPEVQWNDVPVDFLAVSDPVSWYIEQVLGKKAAIIRPAIDSQLFHPSPAPPDGVVRIAFMPRKNKAQAVQIERIFRQRNPRARVEWVCIENLDRAGVAEKMRSCQIFLATGFPEGCPLPPLEALASGCLCAGFTGFGGLDYMRQYETGCWAFHEYSLRVVPWSGNGWWVADLDVLGAARALEKAVVACQQKTPFFSDRELMLEHYSYHSQQREIKAWLTGLGT